MDRSKSDATTTTTTTTTIRTVLVLAWKRKRPIRHLISFFLYKKFEEMQQDSKGRVNSLIFGPFMSVLLHWPTIVVVDVLAVDSTN
jgi:hypothetical protein